MKPIFTAIVEDDRRAVESLLKADPGLATRRTDKARLFDGKILHWIYVGDTALHLAAAGHRLEIAGLLLAACAMIRGRIRVRSGSQQQPRPNPAQTGHAPVRKGQIQADASGNGQTEPDDILRRHLLQLPGRLPQKQGKTSPVAPGRTSKRSKSTGTGPFSPERRRRTRLRADAAPSAPSRPIQ